MHALKTALAIFGGITLTTTLLSAWTYFRGDRTGNSGQHGHFDDNRRIDGPFRRFSQDFGPGPPSAANLEVAMDMGRYVESFRWKGDPIQ